MNRNEPSVSSEKRGQIESQEELRRKEREARKRSRWGRTLSEEREFQEQRKCEIELKRTEVEMKFQSYEKEQQLLPPVPPSENSNSEATNVTSEDATNMDVQNTTNDPAVESEPNGNIAQQTGSLSTVPPDPAPTEIVVPRQEETSNLPEPVSMDTNSCTKPALEEPVSETAPMSRSEVSNSTSLETDSHHQSNNHVNCENIEIPSSTEIPSKLAVEEAVSNVLPDVLNNDSQVPENTEAAESCTAPEVSES